MIYRGAEYTIELDLRADLNQWAYNFLTNAHFENVSLDHALYQYFDMQLRLLKSRPRIVLVSKEFVVPHAVRTGYEYFKAAVEKGDQLLPFMSKSIVDVSYKDKMIFDWGLYHFHLSKERDPKDSRFMARSDYLLIAYVNPRQDDSMYFLQVRPHKSSIWTEQDLIRILADNWPEVMEPFRIKGEASLTQNVSDEDYKCFRKNNVTTMVDLHDGRVYLGANLGLNSAGTSTRAVLQYNKCSNNAIWLEQEMGKSVDDIGKTINLKLKEPEKEFKLRLITPGDRDYLFMVEGYGFLLRFIAKGKKNWIIVGDTAAQIEAAIT